jgi:hypothetical protein
LTTILAELAADGYDADFYARDGKLMCRECDEAIDPATVVIERVARLEGDSDPDEEVAVFAISEGPCGRKGTYTVVYGPNVPDADAAIELRLRDARRR